MAEQTNNTDMSEEPDRQDLEDRVDQLESTIAKMLPSRRDALKLGGAALVGGAAMSGTASAGDESEGTIGTSGSPVDVESEDINNADTVTTENLVVNGTATGPFGGGIIFEEGDSLTEHSGVVITVQGDSFGTIFDLSSPVDVYGGSIFGNDVSRLRVTFGTSTVQSFGGRAIGETRTDDDSSVMTVFPMKNVKKMEFRNEQSSSERFGFNVFTT